MYNESCSVHSKNLPLQQTGTKGKDTLSRPKVRGEVYSANKQTKVVVNLCRMLELALIAVQNTRLALIAPKTIACGATMKNVALIKMVICLRFLMDNVANGLLNRIAVDLLQVIIQIFLNLMGFPILVVCQRVRD